MGLEPPEHDDYNNNGNPEYEDDYDPQGKEKKQSPIKLFIKLGAILVCSLGMIAALRIHKAKLETQIQQMKENAGDAVVQESPGIKSKASLEVKSSGGGVYDITPKTPAPPTPPPTPGATSNPALAFSKNKPLIILSLPHNADLAVARWLRCAGVLDSEMSKYWAPLLTQTQQPMPLGLCMKQNLKNFGPEYIINNCGVGQSVLSEIQFIGNPTTHGTNKVAASCFDPVLFPGALSALQQAIPNAYILTVQQDPAAWYQQLPKDLKAHWKKWCNPLHENAFPSSSKSESQYIEFYQDYHTRLESFVEQEAKGWTYISIDLQNNDATTTATMLENHLKTSQQCWLDAINSETPLRVGAHVEGLESLNAIHPQQQLMTIQYPILSVSLPLRSIDHNYFRCGLGPMKVAHQWTTPSTSTITQPQQDLPIGMCIERNVKNPADSKNNILKGCGHARVWSDIGYLRDKDHSCYYPTLQEGVLEQFAKYYPTSTIFHTVFEDPVYWTRSIAKHDLAQRWSAANCKGMPAVGASTTDWVNFYKQHVQSIRALAKKFPNITYVELPYSKQGGEMLQEIYMFPERCTPQINDLG